MPAALANKAMIRDFPMNKFANRYLLAPIQLLRASSFTFSLKEDTNMATKLPVAEIKVKAAISQLNM